MRTFLTFFTVFFKNYIKNKALLLCLFCLPISVFMLISALTQLEESNLKVLLFFDENTDITEEISENLTLNTQISFELAQNKQEIYDKIVFDDYVCGFIFKDNFSDNIKSLDFDEYVEIISLSDSPYDNITKTVVFSSIFETIVPYISQNKLNEYEITKSIEDLHAEIEIYKQSGFSANIYYDNSNTSVTRNDNTYIYSIISGVICIFLVFFSTLSTIYSADDFSDFIFVPHLDRFRLQLCKVFPLYFLSTSFAGLTLVTACILLPELSLFYEISRLLFFQFTLIFLNIAIGRIFSKNILLLMIPFEIIFILATHPIFVDFSLFFPTFSRILYISPAYQYLVFDLTSIILMIFTILTSIFVIKKRPSIKLKR